MDGGSAGGVSGSGAGGTPAAGATGSSRPATAGTAGGNSSTSTRRRARNSAVDMDDSELEGNRTDHMSYSLPQDC